MYNEPTGFISQVKNVFTSHSENTSVTEVYEHKMQRTIVEDTDVPSVETTGNESETEKVMGLRTVEVTAPKISLPEEKNLDIGFATNFIKAGGKFIFCENMKQAVESLQALKAEFRWHHIYSWENEIKDAFTENNFQKGMIGYTLENSDAAISLCDSLIAGNGAIILNPKQASRRRLPVFPKTHIIITDIAHLTSNEETALEKFHANNKGELPSIINLAATCSGHFYDKVRLIMNAGGTDDVYVILLDEIIPPSLRP